MEEKNNWDGLGAIQEARKDLQETAKLMKDRESGITAETEKFMTNIGKGRGETANEIRANNNRVIANNPRYPEKEIERMSRGVKPIDLANYYSSSSKEEVLEKRKTSREISKRKTSRGKVVVRILIAAGIVCSLGLGFVITEKNNQITLDNSQVIVTVSNEVNGGHFDPYGYYSVEELCDMADASIEKIGLEEYSKRCEEIKTGLNQGNKGPKL